MSIPANPFRQPGYVRPLFLISFIVMFAGIGVALLISKWSRLLGVALFLVGAVLMYLTSRLGTGSGLRSDQGFLFPRDGLGRIPVISERIVDLYTLRGRYPWLMTLTGILLALGVIFYNYYVQVNTYLGSNDYVVLMLALSIGSYVYIPKKYAVERDFMLMFLTLLFLIVVIPTTYYTHAHGSTGGSWEDHNPDSDVIHYLLARPLAFMVNTFFGRTHVDVDGVLLTYHDVGGNRLEVSIALGCTGLYSASIFLSAFIAYILVEYRQFDARVGILLALGILTSYIANLLRMIIILLVGYYYGMDALLTAHANVGELIFLFWIAIFWGLMFKYLDIKVPWDPEGDPAPASPEQDATPSGREPHPSRPEEGREPGAPTPTGESHETLSPGPNLQPEGGPKDHGERGEGIPSVARKNEGSPYSESSDHSR